MSNTFKKLGPPDGLEGKVGDTELFLELKDDEDAAEEASTLTNRPESVPTTSRLPKRDEQLTLTFVRNALSEMDSRSNRFDLFDEIEN